MQRSSQVRQRPRVLITGAAGTIGSRIVTDLAKDFDLKLTDLHEGQCDAGPIHPLDITDFHQVCDAMQGVDMVAHLAIASVRAMQHLPEHEIDDTHMRVNVIGTQHVFEAARLAGVRRVAFGSSLTTVMGTPHYEHVDAGTPPRPVNLYACTKLFGEHLAELYARQFNLPVVCLRIGQPCPLPPKFGYDQLHSRRFRSVAVAFEDLAQAVRCALREDGPDFAVATIISESDCRFMEPVATEEIGYRPLVYFTADGPIANTAELEGKSP